MTKAMTAVGICVLAGTIGLIVGNRAGDDVGNLVDVPAGQGISHDSAAVPADPAAHLGHGHEEHAGHEGHGSAKRTPRIDPGPRKLTLEERRQND